MKQVYGSFSQFLNNIRKNFFNCETLGQRMDSGVLGALFL